MPAEYPGDIKNATENKHIADFISIISQIPPGSKDTQLPDNKQSQKQIDQAPDGESKPGRSKKTRESIGYLACAYIVNWQIVSHKINGNNQQIKNQI